MGNHKNISATSFPRQGNYLGMPTEVCFHYNTSVMFSGRIVRDDAEEPFQTLIQIDNGPIVTATECQYSPKEADSMTTEYRARANTMPDIQDQAVTLSDPDKSNDMRIIVALA